MSLTCRRGPCGRRDRRTRGSEADAVDRGRCGRHFHGPGLCRHGCRLDRRAQDLDHARRPLARRRAGADGALRQVRHPARDDRRGVPRHHHRHQFHPRARRRRHRHDHHRRLSRYPAHRPPPAAAALLDHAGHPVAEPAAGQAPASQDGDGAAGAAARRGAGAARRGRRPPGGARAQGSGRAGDRHLLPVLLPRSGARGAGARHRARGISRLLRHHLLVGVAAVPRVRALHHHGAERLRRPQGAQLRDAARIGDRGLGLQGRPPHHGVQRRRGDARHGGRAAGAHPAVGPGGRRDRRRLGGRPRRAGATSSPSMSAAPRPISASSPKAASARRRRATPGSRASPSWCR